MKPKTKYFEDHKPVTRRQFMGMGLAASEMYLMMPTVLDLLLCKSARAEDIMKPPHATFIIDCAGGMAGGQFWLPVKYGAGQTVQFDYLAQSAYQILGVTTNVASGSGTVDTRFGVHLSTSSPMYAPFIQNLSAEALARTSITMISHRGQDDSGSNQNSVAGPLMNYYATEERPTGGISSGLAMSNSRSGGQTQTPVVPARPFMQVTDAASIARAFSSTSATLTESSVKKMIDAVVGITKHQGTRNLSKVNADQISAKAQEAYKQNKDNIKAPPPTDPLSDDGFAILFGLKDAAGNVLTVTNEHRQVATIVFNVFKGTAQPLGVLSLGGFDYHTGNRTQMISRETALATYLGKIASAATYFKVKTSIHTLSDGGMGFNANGDPVADRGSGSGTWSFWINGDSDAAVRPALTRAYLNDYSDAAGANVTNPIGAANNTNLVAYATLANYFRFIGKPQMIDRYIPAGLFPNADATKLVAG